MSGHDGDPRSGRRSLTRLGILAAVTGLLAVTPPVSPAGATAGTGHAALAAASEPCAERPRAFFEDVHDAATAAPSIDCLVWFGITRGVTYDRFGAGLSLQRAQFASLLDRLLATAGVPLADPSSPVFADVEGIHAPAIDRLATAGIVQGREPGRFDPGAPVRRDQLATMVVEAYEWIAGSQVEPAPFRFTDLDGNVHAGPIARAVALELVQGTTATTYGPAEVATRSQTAIVLARLLDRLAADGLFGPGVATQDVRRIGAIPAGLRAEMERSTWQPECPVPLEDLRLVEVVHVDFDGVERWGRLVVHAEHAGDVAHAFGELHALGFPIDRMEPVERFGGDDDASMAANNTSAFNCRRVTGSTSFSRHAYGTAIDINPVQNPYVRGTTVLPPAGRAFTDRFDERPGMLVRPGAVEVFDRLGWGWGGDWSSLKDYQHVSVTGR